jgi:signal transduction histidine kinase
MELFLLFIFYNYAKVEEEHQEESLFLEMKNYSYSFDGDKFEIGFPSYHGEKFYELYKTKENFILYIDTGDDKNDILSLTYPRKKFDEELALIYKRLLVDFIILSIVAFAIALLFSFYTLYPLQNAYRVLQEFMKDIVHDINTPLSAIKLNLSMIEKKDEEIEAIEQSVNTLEMLHKNIDNYLGESHVEMEKFELSELIVSQVKFFQTLYDWLEWDVEVENEIIESDKYLLSRIIYNLLHNASKYNTPNGFVKVIYKKKQLQIINSSYGIKNPKMIFERFYKEGERGLGIGLHIVSKLSDELKIKYEVEVDDKKEVTVKLTLK